MPIPSPINIPRCGRLSFPFAILLTHIRTKRLTANYCLRRKRIASMLARRAFFSWGEGSIDSKILGSLAFSGSVLGLAIVDDSEFSLEARSVGSRTGSITGSLVSAGLLAVLNASDFAEVALWRGRRDV
jgi:hypothetical protein